MCAFTSLAGIATVLRPGSRLIITDEAKKIVDRLLRFKVKL